MKRSNNQVEPTQVEPTLAKQWAQKRNWRKYQLQGIRGQLEGMRNDLILSRPFEQIQLALAIFSIAKLIESWQKGNKYSKQNFIEDNSR